MDLPDGYEQPRQLLSFEAWDKPNWRTREQPPKFMTRCDDCGWVHGEATRRWVREGAYYHCPQCDAELTFNRIEP